ncbi:MAG: hypothetical protein ACP5NV_03055 [Candidatus Woesearchaeota archaeon]
MIGTILALLIAIVAIFVGLKILKSIILFKVLFKVVSIVFVLLIIFLIIGTIYILKDANDFKNNFSSSKNMFILAESNEESVNEDEIDIINIESAFELRNKTYIEVSDFEKLAKSYKTYEFSDINEDYYKIFVIKTSVLDEIESIELSELKIELKGNEIRAVLESEDAGETLISILEDEYDIKNPEVDFDNDELKQYLFTYTVTEIFNPKNVNILFSGIKDGAILVYEDSALFKSIRYIPTLFIKDATGKMFS